MNREELSKLFLEALKPKLIGTNHINNRKICDVELEINDCYEEYDGGGSSYDELRIRVKTLSKKGKNSKWENYYF